MCKREKGHHWSPCETCSCDADHLKIHEGQASLQRPGGTVNKQVIKLNVNKGHFSSRVRFNNLTLLLTCTVFNGVLVKGSPALQ